MGSRGEKQPRFVEKPAPARVSSLTLAISGAALAGAACFTPTAVNVVNHHEAERVTRQCARDLSMCSDLDGKPPLANWQKYGATAFELVIAGGLGFGSRRALRREYKERLAVQAPTPTKVSTPEGIAITKH